MPIEKIRTYLDPKIHLDRWVAIFSLIGFVWAGLSFVDTRYVKAADYSTEMTDLKKDSDRFRTDIRTALLIETINLRKTIIQDALFELEFKRRSDPKTWTALEEAKYQRYIREYNEVELRLSTAIQNRKQ